MPNRLHTRSLDRERLDQITNMKFDPQLFLYHSSIEWLVRMIVSLAFTAFRKISCICCRALGSTPVVGSSRIATSGGPSETSHVDLERERWRGRIYRSMPVRHATVVWFHHSADGCSSFRRDPTRRVNWSFQQPNGFVWKEHHGYVPRGRDSPAQWGNPCCNLAVDSNRGGERIEDDGWHSVHQCMRCLWWPFRHQRWCGRWSFYQRPNHAVRWSILITPIRHAALTL